MEENLGNAAGASDLTCLRGVILLPRIMDLKKSDAGSFHIYDPPENDADGLSGHGGHCGLTSLLEKINMVS